MLSSLANKHILLLDGEHSKGVFKVCRQDQRKSEVGSKEVEEEEEEEYRQLCKIMQGEK